MAVGENMSDDELRTAFMEAVDDGNVDESLFARGASRTQKSLTRFQGRR